MRVLVACEESQAVTLAFRRRGHEAFSADLQPCSGGHPEWHIQGDATALLDDGWDLLIAHPPCTYISNAGAPWLFRGGEVNQERLAAGMEGKKLFLKFWDAPVKKVCVENPIPSSIFGMPPYTQVVQPFHHGHPFRKTTALWLRGGLAHLVATENLGTGESTVTAAWYNGWAKGDERRKNRAKTFPGIAEAMAEQWGTDWTPPDLELMP